MTERLETWVGFAALLASVACAGEKHPTAQAPKPAQETTATQAAPAAPAAQPVASVAVPASNAAAAAEPGAPCDADGMRRFEGAQFLFRAPCSWQGGPRQGIDSRVGQYQADGVRADYDYGAYSSPLTEFADYPGYARKTLRIDGREAYLVVVDQAPTSEGTPFVAGVHIPKANAHAKLTLIIRASTREARDRLLDVFRTIDLE